jgi:hypothetical protein
LKVKAKKILTNLAGEGIYNSSGNGMEKENEKD